MREKQCCSVMLQEHWRNRHQLLVVDLLESLRQSTSAAHVAAVVRQIVAKMLQLCRTTITTKNNTPGYTSLALKCRVYLELVRGALSLVRRNINTLNQVESNDKFYSFPLPMLDESAVNWRTDGLRNWKTGMHTGCWLTRCEACSMQLHWSPRADSSWCRCWCCRHRWWQPTAANSRDGQWQ